MENLALQFFSSHFWINSVLATELARDKQILGLEGQLPIMRSAFQLRGLRSSDFAVLSLYKCRSRISDALFCDITLIWGSLTLKWASFNFSQFQFCRPSSGHIPSPKGSRVFFISRWVNLSVRWTSSAVAPVEGRGLSKGTAESVRGAWHSTADSSWKINQHRHTWFNRKPLPCAQLWVVVANEEGAMLCSSRSIL